MFGVVDAGSNIVTVHRTLEVQPETVFSFLAERDRWTLWQGIGAVIDPRPGGTFLVNLLADKWLSGRFNLVEQNRRLVFSWGTECGKWGVPPGSSSVEITLDPRGPIGTDLWLIHRGLSLPAVGDVLASWRHYVDRLVLRATGLDPGPDRLPICDER